MNVTGKTQIGLGNDVGDDSLTVGSTNNQYQEEPQSLDVDKDMPNIGGSGKGTTTLDPSKMGFGGLKGGSGGNQVVTGENQYGDIAGNKQSYSPNSEGRSNTGQGAAAALGQQYTWDQSGAEKAKKTYTSDVLEARQNQLTNRQTIANNALDYQKQTDMQKYVDNQNAEKVGWTGGYVLDQQRQSEYLKASIQAQMYGAMELQKYGYDSALAAARLSYDLNQQEYARQYYQDAVSAALSEAQLTGVYFSAETKDMMSQLAVAEQKLKDESISEDERQRAQGVVDTINGWFSANRISKEGVKTLEAWQTEQAQELEWNQQIWTRYQAAIQAAKTDLETNSNEFLYLDANGREVWDGVNVTVGNWETMSGKQIIDYMKTSGQAANQFYSYLDSTLTGEVESGFSKWCQTNGYMTKNEDGTFSANSENDYVTLLKGYIYNSNILEKFERMFSGAPEKEVTEKIGNWDFTIQLPNGEQLNVSYNDLVNGNYGQNVIPGKTAPAEQEGVDKDGNPMTYKWSASETIQMQNAHGATGDTYYKTTLTVGNNTGKKICVTTAKAVIEAGKGYGYQDDVAIRFYKDESTSTNKYDAEFEDNSPAFDASSAEYQEISAYIKSVTGSDPQVGQIIVVNGDAYTYYEKGDGDKFKGYYRLGGQCGKSNIYEELQKTGQWVS